MSEVERRQQMLADSEAALAAEYGEGTVEEADTDEGIPEESMESEAGEDGALAAVDTEEEESDTDGIPDDDESDESSLDKRLKDTQAAYTQVSQELSALKSEMANHMGEITQTKFDLSDRMTEAEQVAEFWANQANADVMRLQQVNPQQLTQEQYGAWQQQMAAAQQRAAQLGQALNQTKERAKAVVDEARRREAAIARSSLERSIDNFEAAYPEIGKFAIENGVSPRVWQELTDPGMVKLLYKMMTESRQPDAIETVKKVTKAKKQKVRNLRERDEAGRFKKARSAMLNARSPMERKAAAQAMERQRLEREYGR